jgi:biotin carboxyl carrier protein
MKYKIRIDDQNFEVEVNDIHSHPIKVKVDGETYDVWPETVLPDFGQSRMMIHPLDKINEPLLSTEKLLTGKSMEPEKAPPPDRVNAIRAPIPGIIIKVSIQTGAEVEFGQELCVLEAMKMNNLIRSPRAGTIAVISVSEGKHVKHGDLLMEFA